MEKLLFADVFKKTFKKVLHVPKVVIDDPIFRLHYRVTGLALFFISIVVTGYQFIGEPIRCIQRDDIPEDLLNTYCWIEGTFSLPRALTKKVGVDVVYPGIDKYQQGDTVVEHAYYQWVCFVLFFQSVMFCIPYSLWKVMEGGRMRHIVGEFRAPMPKNPKTNEYYTPNEIEEYYRALAIYFHDITSETSTRYAIQYFVCELLNLINVVGQIFFLDRFLGGYFSGYGAHVVQYATTDQGNRFDPMIRLFPRLTKCTFHRYGSSGDVQKHDALCLLPLNIINEKIFVILWFWFVILAILGCIVLLYRITLMLFKRFRFILLCYVSLIDESEIDEFRHWSYGDWFLLYLLAYNIDYVHFQRFLEKYNKVSPGGEGRPIHEQSEISASEEKRLLAKA